MHVLTPTVLKLLQKNLDSATADQSVDLSTSLAQLAQTERYLAFEVDGSRHNISYKYGLLLAQLAISLGGIDRDLVLTELVAEYLTKADRHLPASQQPTAALNASITFDAWETPHIRLHVVTICTHAALAATLFRKTVVGF